VATWSRDLTAGRDRAADKKRALRMAARAAGKFDQAEADRASAFRFARMSGASLRELEAVTGVPFRTVDRIVDRAGDA
jgi:hypothetical protein